MGRFSLGHWDGIKWDARGLKRGFVAGLEKRISQAERGVNFEKPRYSRGDFTQNYIHKSFASNILNCPPSIHTNKI